MSYHSVYPDLLRILRGTLTVCLMLFGLIGCSQSPKGPARMPVSGAVSLDGIPVESGSIGFLPDGETRGPSGGANIVKGRYTISAALGLVQGSHKVQINAPRKTGKQIEVGSPSPPGTMMDETEESIPPQYNAESTLTVNIEKGHNTHDFKLTSK